MDSLTVDKHKDLRSEVKLWQERVSIAKRSNEDWARESGADRFVDEYNGKFELFFNGLKGKIPVPPVNEVFAYVQADLANTYNRDPYISVNPKSGSVRGAKIWEVILNYYWRHLKTKEEVEPEIIDKDLVGFAWHKVGYNVETEGAEEELKIIKEGLYSARVDWKDVVWNLGAKKVPYDCMWMAQRIVKPLETIKKKYPNAVNLEGIQNPEVDKGVYDSSQFKDDLKVGVIWEIWDLDARQIRLIAEGLNEKYLENPKPFPEYMDEFPFLQYWDYLAPGKKRPMSAIAPWEPQILEAMVILAAAVNHAKRWSRQMLVRKGFISGADLDKFERGDDGAVIDYTGTGNLKENVDMIDWGNIPVDYYQLLDRLAAIKRDVNGQPEFERGGVTKTSTRTEGELQMISQGAKGRSDRRVDRFETHLENIARHMMKHLKANFDFEETVRITGEEPEAILEALGDHLDPVTGTVSFTVQDIDGDYDVEVKAGSTLPLDRENKMKVLNTILQTVGNVSADGVSPLLQALIGEMLDEYDMKSLKLAYQAEQEQTQQDAERQQQETNADDIKARSQAAKNVAQADKIGAETDVIRTTPIPEEEPVEAGV